MAQATDIVVHEMRANLGLARPLVADVPDEAMTRQFGELRNHAAWQVGHIVVSMAFAAKITGADYAPPEGWEKLFPPGTKPVDDPGLYPAKAELVRELDRVCEALSLQLPKLDAAALDAPFPDEKFRSFWPTVADGLQFFAVSHFAFHLGQLSAWRRAMGLPSALGM